MGTDLEIKATSSLQRYLKEDLNIEGDDTAKVYCSKNESRSFQIFIANKDLIESLAISLKVEGFEETNINVAMYREHYVNIEQTTNNKQIDIRYEYKTGYHPDALIPFINPHSGERIIKNSITDIVLENPLIDKIYYADDYNIPKESSQGYWIDVEVGKQTIPGKYSGNIIITEDEIELKRIPIIVNVLYYEFPDKHDYKIQMTNVRNTTAHHFGITTSEPKWDTLNNNGNKTFKDNLMYPYLHLATYGFPVNSLIYTDDDLYDKIYPNSLIELYRQFTETYKTNSFIFSTYYFHQYTNTNDIEKRAKWFRMIEKLIQENSWITNPHIYIDEPNTEGVYNTFIEYSTAAATFCPSVKMMVTEQCASQFPDTHPDGLDGYVDVRVLLFDLFEKDCIHHLGEETWSYTALTQGTEKGICNWHIDAPYLQYLVPQWISYYQGLTGILYWGGSVYWEGRYVATVNPWVDPNSYPVNSVAYNGEGYLFYPSNNAGYNYDFVPSIRAKVFKESIQDYQNFKILGELVGEQKVKTIISEAATFFNDFTFDINIYNKIRKKTQLMISDINEGRKYIEDIDSEIVLDITQSISKYRMIPEERDIVTISIDGVNIAISGLLGLMWDVGGEEHLFTYDGEYIDRKIKNNHYKIYYEGDRYLFNIQLFGSTILDSYWYKEVADLINYMECDETVLEIRENRNMHINYLNDSWRLLYNDINNTIRMINDHQLNYDVFMKKYVLSVQGFVSLNYSSVNDYLRDNNIKVHSIFAGWSSEVGYPIDSSNIDIE